MYLNQRSRDAGVQAIEKLMQKKGKYDYVLVETTGLADPGVIASMFWMDDALESVLYLDGIVTVVDAKNVARQVGDHSGTTASIPEAVRQIALADRILLNKVDLASAEEVSQAKETIGAINGSAPIELSERSRVPLDFILDIRAFDHVNVQVNEHVHDEHCSHSHGAATHALGDTVVHTIVVTLDKQLDLKGFQAWLQRVLWEKVKNTFYVCFNAFIFRNCQGLRCPSTYCAPRASSPLPGRTSGTSSRSCTSCTRSCPRRNGRPTTLNGTRVGCSLWDRALTGPSCYHRSHRACCKDWERKKKFLITTTRVKVQKVIDFFL